MRKSVTDTSVMNAIGLSVLVVLFLYVLGTPTITGSQVQDTINQPVSIHLGGLGTSEVGLPEPAGIEKITMRTCYNNKKTGQYYRLSIAGYSKAQGDSAAQFTYTIPQAPNWIGGKGKGCQDVTLDSPTPAVDIYKIVATGVPVKGGPRFSADFQVFMKQKSSDVALPVPPAQPEQVPAPPQESVPTSTPVQQPPVPEPPVLPPTPLPQEAPQVQPQQPAQMPPTPVPPVVQAPIAPQPVQPTQASQAPRVTCGVMADEGNQCLVKETGQDGICRRGLTTDAKPMPTIRCVLSNGNQDGCENFGYPCSQRGGSGVCAFTNPTAKDYRLRCYLRTCDAAGSIAVENPSKLMECVKQDQADFSTILKCSDSDKGNLPNVGGKVTYQGVSTDGRILGNNPREPWYNKDNCYKDAKNAAISPVGKLGSTWIMCKNCYLMEYYCLTDKNEINTKKTTLGGQIAPCGTCLRGQMGDYCA